MGGPVKKTNQFSAAQTVATVPAFIYPQYAIYHLPTMRVYSKKECAYPNGPIIL
jgi:hypothetical protein